VKDAYSVFSDSHTHDINDGLIGCRAKEVIRRIAVHEGKKHRLSRVYEVLYLLVTLHLKPHLRRETVHVFGAFVLAVIYVCALIVLGYADNCCGFD
jgi:hypothetical protein